MAIANAAIVRPLGEHRLEVVGAVKKVWTGRLGIGLTLGTISVGDRLLLVKEGWCTSHIVTSLQSHDQSGDRFMAVAGGELDVSAQVSTVPTGALGAAVYLISNEWTEYWPGEERWTADLPGVQQN